jgi:DNA-binding IclR family transcriptional regulator
MSKETSTAAGKQIVRSAEIGTDILRALAQLAPSASISGLARHIGMPAAKIHRYLQALISSGFAEQDAQTITGVLTVVGSVSNFDAELDSDQARILRQSAQRLSTDLGFREARSGEVEPTEVQAPKRRRKSAGD